MNHVTIPLCELFQIGSSKRVLKSEWKDAGVPFYRGREVTRLAIDGSVNNELFITEEHYTALSKSNGVPSAGDIIITAIGTIGNSYIVQPTDRFYFKDASILWMKRNSDVLSEYVNLWLKSTLFFEQLDRGNGATVDTLTIKKLQSVRIRLPPLAEQRRIVDILDEAFEAIAVARANAEQNRQNARSLFESHLQSVFSLRGEGWIDSRLGEIAEVQSGGTPTVSQKDFWGGDIPWYSSGELNHTFTSVPERHITADGLEHSNAKLFPKGSLLVGMYDTAALKMSILDRDGAFNQAIAGIKPNHRIDVEFILHAINAAKPKLLLERRGVRQKNLSLGKIKDISIPLPTLEIQRSILVRIRKLAYETQRLQYLYQRKIAALDELKQSLLHQAFSGQL
ncbi:restriction endonuclease subunit S [Aeromonas dhakensis]|uniref:restriction endonuclease subunit S n=1 Tax=Aeromonas dhakensis TaxID=196024 RepID=UPI003A1EAEDA